MFQALGGTLPGRFGQRTHTPSRRGARATTAFVAIALAAGSVVALATPTGAAPTPVPATSHIPTGASANQLAGVSCPSATHCFAVGQSAATASAQQWNGKTWSVATSPAIVGSALDAVSCASTTSCFAVGSQLVSGATKALIERWNGAAWSTVASANPTGTTGAQLTGVSCTSPTFCVAVGKQSVAGSTVSKTLIERWNGKKWSITTSPNPAGGRAVVLNAVSCTSTLGCEAVGSYNTAAGALLTLIARWNGTAWSTVASPGQGAPLGGELLGVSCSSAANCVAVGEDHVASQNGSAVAEVWNGKKWAVVAPRSDGRSVNHLASVSCVSTTSCTAVGYVQNYGPDDSGASLSRVERWNGKNWSVVASPSPGATRSQLAAVACKTATSCVAVGRATNSAFERSLSNLQTLAEQWNGSTWSTMSSANPISAPFAVFDGVSCTSATNCFAVGNVMSVPGRNRTFVQRFDGTAWTNVASANPTGATISQLAGVSCTSASSCVAVGRYTTSTATNAADAGPFKTLVEQWDGTSWSIVASPNPAGATFSRLDRVSCTSTNSCMAIGVSSTTVGGADNPLAERWNGAAWSVVPSAADAPNPTGKTMELSGLSCTSPTHCLAVYSFSPGRYPGWLSWIFAEQWDGTSWKEAFTAENLIEFDETLSGVSCTSATVCMVTGAYTNWIGDSFLATDALAEQVNGTDWSVVDYGSVPGHAHPRLDAVSCTSATHCLSVGASSTTESTFDAPQTLTEQWNGTSWSVVASPNPAGAAASELVSVSCPTASSCVAVGDSQVASTGETRPLTEVWNGKTWAIVATPNPSAA